MPGEVHAMKRTCMCIVGIAVCAAIAMMLYPGTAPAATCEKWAGKIVSAQGVVEAKPAGETKWKAVKLNETYCPGDTIRTDRKSRADIALYNHPVLRLDQNSTVTLGGMKDERTSLVDMVSGAALFFSRVTRNLEVRTATVNAGVEGTEFFLRAEEGRTELTVFEGKVLASNAGRGLPVTTGQSAVAEAGKAPVYRVVVRPRDAVHWALYYPHVLDGRPADMKEDGNDPRFYTARASQLLTVGRVDEAVVDIDKAQKLDPKNSDAFALQSIVAVTQNEKGKALELAGKAVAADPKSATAKIALSYAQQAHFDLPGALGGMEEAVKLSPGNALAWARLAELRQSFGYLDQSLDAAKKAVATNPDLSRTQTVLGFSHLTRIETKEAADDFEKAIRLDDADPLPRLGLGLAKIRDGNVEEGRREIEIAMSLDPNSSIIRSYLGKAYFEEKRDKLARGQYEMAKSLDPSDPTPYFYDAIRKQTTNRPVEALKDLETAIERNDNRAVYRSRLLLDDDLAARSASIGRIYNDLGFQDRALVEGWRSVSYDPANYSAHRFLADSYAALPRHEIARVSELLQSQLLQPLNLTPVQPRLGESNLLAISAGGPADLSFNEFNPLFQRNRLALQASGIAGENGTWGEEVVVSGLYKKLSASVGQNHNETDGFRANNDLKDDIYNAYFQASLSPKTSVMAEYRYRKSEHGDLQLRFFPEDFSLNLREEEKRRTFIVGGRQSFAPGSDLIGYFMKGKDTVHQTNSPDSSIAIDGRDEADAYGGEVQYLFRSEKIKVVTGAGYFDIDQKATFNTDIVIDPTPPPFIISLQDVIDLGTTHKNVYLYTYLNFLKNVTFTAGGSGDFYDGSQVDKNQFNPKFGVTWDVVKDTTLRAAAFRTLKRTLITNQTLEPTQVAGFNQFYDDPNATDTWNYGIGVDRKFSASLFGGAEYTKRDQEITFYDLGNQAKTSTDWKEQAGRAYLHWTPNNLVALNAGYVYEKFEQTSVFNLGYKTVETHRIPLGGNFYHPCGFIFMGKATFVDQKGEFSTQSTPFDFTAGDDRFWVVDAAVGYRLPQRYGFITVGAKNLFDRSFRYADTDFANPAIQPARMFFARFTLSI
jgi:tetratricopeptide (TPR) repeat protein